MSIIKAPPVVAVAGWIFPGLGHVLIGQRTRGIVIGAMVLFLFIAGLFVAGIRVLEVPMYDDLGESIGNVTLVSEVRAKPWIIAQVLVGPVNLVADYLSVQASRIDPATGAPAGAISHARLAEIGTLYTAVAGMLNLLSIIDATSRAAREEHE